MELSTCFKYCLTWLLLILSPGFSAHAADHYVRSGAAGLANGSDWANAWPTLPGKLIRGDTYYVAGGDYGAYFFNTPEISSQYINIVKATAQSHGTDAGWQDAYGIGAARFTGLLTFVTGYWRIDGAVGKFKGATQPYGFEINITDTGSGVELTDSFNSGHLRFSHVKLWKPDKDDPAYAGGRAFDFTTLSGSNTDIVIDSCYIFNFALPLYYYYSDNITVERTVIQDNRSTAANHSEAASIRFSDYLVFRYNWFEDMEGTGGIMAMSGDQSHWDIYGNVFYWSGDPTCEGFGHGAIADNFNGSTTDIKVYNNTFVNLLGKGGLAFFAPTTDVVAVNNLFFNSAVSNLGIDQWSNNTYAGDSTCINTLFEGTIGATVCLEIDEADCPVDVSYHDAGAEDPFVDSSNENFLLIEGTMPGLDLGAPYNTDYYNLTRGSDGVWDRGAYESTPQTTTESGGGGSSGCFIDILCPVDR